ncbi:MAG: Copper amine oxidase domain protein [Candidatus Falkowbacteria bacterium GW2011_GWF2_39_8]|uniref:Copper amine oxidase domain protein n=1 Tax=Candidatus Falkowbacteria bacterium GW2011_GWF2_39_8 TaxID=1618642 RepID=A0A0G0Q376_9BACT|nr:MAG: Copper amine oxidase domain protein [Candidatus Falkowbacteria bacterium GW2011_GWF2_39_8]
MNVESKGEAWYVNPVNHQRYSLGRPDDAFRVMRQLGLGISEIDFQKIAQAGMPIAGDLSIARRLSGRIIIETEKNGEAWYVNPLDLKKYYLGRPSDAFQIMRKLGLGITRTNLAKIHKFGSKDAINSYSSYEYKTIKTKSGDFLADVITIDLANPDLKIITDTANDFNCKSGCRARSLIDYVNENDAFAGINGSYFDTSWDKKNYYFFPVYNSNKKIFINEDQLKWWTTGPVMAFDTNNKFYYFKDSREFKGVADFESKFGVKLQAAIGNKPRLTENGLNQLIDWEVDLKQRTVKTSRNAIGYKNNKIYLIVAYKATVPDLANVSEALGMEYALNLDGGYSTAMFYNDELVSGPGRDIPNVILFANK